MLSNDAGERARKTVLGAKPKDRKPVARRNCLATPQALLRVVEVPALGTAKYHPRQDISIHIDREYLIAIAA